MRHRGNALESLAVICISTPPMSWRFVKFTYLRELLQVMLGSQKILERNFWSRNVPI